MVISILVYFISICYPDKGLAELGRKRSIFITIYFECLIKT